MKLHHKMLLIALLGGILWALGVHLHLASVALPGIVAFIVGVVMTVTSWQMEKAAVKKEKT